MLNKSSWATITDRLRGYGLDIFQIHGHCTAILAAYKALFISNMERIVSNITEESLMPSKVVMYNRLQQADDERRYNHILAFCFRHLDQRVPVRLYNSFVRHDSKYYKVLNDIETDLHAIIAPGFEQIVLPSKIPIRLLHKKIHTLSKSWNGLMEIVDNISESISSVSYVALCDKIKYLYDSISYNVGLEHDYERLKQLYSNMQHNYELQLATCQDVAVRMLLTLNRVMNR